MSQGCIPRVQTKDRCCEQHLGAPTQGSWPPKGLFCQISLPTVRATTTATRTLLHTNVELPENNGTDTHAHKKEEPQKPLPNRRQARGQRASTGKQALRPTRTGVGEPVSKGQLSRRPGDQWKAGSTGGPARESRL